MIQTIFLDSANCLQNPLNASKNVGLGHVLSSLDKFPLRNGNDARALSRNARNNPFVSTLSLGMIPFRESESSSAFTCVVILDKS